MTPRRFVAASDASEVLRDAVAESALAVVSVQLDDGWVSYKSRFLERDPRQRFFVLDHQETHGVAPPELRIGQYVGVSVRHRSRKVLFASVVEAKGRFYVEANTAVPAVRLRWPDAITELQRRAYQRTPVPPGSDLGLRIWGGGLAVPEGSRQHVIGSPLDLSCGGTLVRLDARTIPDWVEDQTLGVEFELRDGQPPALMNAFHRGYRVDQGAPAAALQFVGLELSHDGRETLQRIARRVQALNRQAYGLNRSAGATVSPGNA